MRQIHRKHSKSVGKLIVCKFTNGFLSPSVITDEFRINLSVNLFVIIDGSEICW